MNKPRKRSAFKQRSGKLPGDRTYSITRTASQTKSGHGTSYSEARVIGPGSKSVERRTMKGEKAIAKKVVEPQGYGRDPKKTTTRKERK